MEPKLWITALLACVSLSQSAKAAALDSDALYRQAHTNAIEANEAFTRSRRYVEGWLAQVREALAQGCDSRLKDLGRFV